MQTANISPWESPVLKHHTPPPPIVTAGGGQVAEHSPSMHEALGVTPGSAS